MTDWRRTRVRPESATMLDKIISSGGTGASRAAWQVAARFGVATGGSMPRGFLSDDGPHREFAGQFSATELPTESEPASIERNVLDADATLWFGKTTTAAASVSVGACQRLGRPCMPVYPAASFEPSQIAEWISEHQIRTLNVAGNSEHDEPGIGERVEAFLLQVLETLGHSPV